MLIRTADLLDLAQAFPASGTAPIFFVVRDSLLEAHRGPMHARVPLCVWARDRVLGWGSLEGVRDSKGAPETMDLERVLYLARSTPREVVQTRAVFAQRGSVDRRGIVDAYLVTRDNVQAFDVPSTGMRIVCASLDLAWAAREYHGLRSTSPFGVARFNLLLRPDAEKIGARLPASARRILGNGPAQGTATIPPAWLGTALRALPHRDGLALIGDRWWATFGYNFEPMHES